MFKNCWHWPSWSLVCMSRIPPDHHIRSPFAWPLFWVSWNLGFGPTLQRQHMEYKTKMKHGPKFQAFYTYRKSVSYQARIEAVSKHLLQDCGIVYGIFESQKLPSFCEKTLWDRQIVHQIHFWCNMWTKCVKEERRAAFNDVSDWAIFFKLSFLSALLSELLTMLVVKEAVCGKVTRLPCRRNGGRLFWSKCRQ